MYPRTCSGLPALVLATFLVACGGLEEEPSAPAAPPAETAQSDAPSTSSPRAPSVPELVAADVGVPSAIAASGGRLVFTTRATILEGTLVSAGALFFVDGVGKPLMISLDRVGAAYEALAVDGANAFVATADGRILAVPLTGGDETVLTSGGEVVVALAASSDHVYFAHASGRVNRVARRGGFPEAVGVVTGLVRGLALDAGAVYVATSGPSGGAIVRLGPGTTPGTTGETVGNVAEAAPCAMVRDGREVYWTSLRESRASAWSRANLHGSLAQARVGATQEPAPRGYVRHLGLDGGEVVTVASGTFAACAPGTLAVDGDHVFWLTQSAVMRVAK